MIQPAELIERCRDAANIMGQDDAGGPVMDGPDSLIGFFQHFRPDGTGLGDVFRDLPGGDEVHERLDRLYDVAGHNQRSDGRRDLYFVVRRPDPIPADIVSKAGRDWLRGVRALATITGDDVTGDALDPMPEIRVLEGAPPKHPKDDVNRSDLLKVFLDRVGQLTGRIEMPHAGLAETLRPAFYFINCDAMLRDYLMWPLYREVVRDQAGDGNDQDAIALVDPFSPYFVLWRHGVKYRIMRKDTVDFYIPRR
ncbi:apolipoprotein acyltransferase [Crateriforma conspicua]|uniref:Uncharacterized protein n=1 Tax=Crateriforma conspicua TaxID=2527996 RepID=A0A5C5Y2S1_9PLAN|nr:apolipoprotein acyltransferase [Crateriforma conspicua]QDV63707.1 hypothetical protein Mal65_28530 [Crateriforma conspicua]TWT69089.1 hypothetical protein Pan14r_13730 [Crateriforma conspicua]